MQVQCCVCKRVKKKEGRWERVKHPENVGSNASHGYCPRCAAKALEEVRAQSGFLKGLRLA